MLRPWLHVDDETKRRLEAINQRFYAGHAARFDATRRAPWRGWPRVLDRIRPRLERAPAACVLDAGCGNGRFARFLDAGLLAPPRGRGGAAPGGGASSRSDAAPGGGAAPSPVRDRAPPVRYLGVDACAELIAIAERDLASLERLTVQLERHDLVHDDLAGLAPGRQFALIALFGVLHHVPGLDARARLLAGLAARLEPGGMLAVSLWRFTQSPRFLRKIIAWDTYNRDAAEPIAVAALEPGDHLLSFDEAGVRYCHEVDADEEEALFAPLGEIEHFEGDHARGDLNRYVLGRWVP